jgi:hypothetical protein
MILRALSVRQPWAWAIVHGLKPWGNRPRRFNYRGPVLIHASKTVETDYEAACLLIERLSSHRPPPLPELGGIVGAAALTGCFEPLTRERGWRCAGQFGLRFECAIALPFRAVPGALGLFKIELMQDELECVNAVGLVPR